MCINRSLSLKTTTEAIYLIICSVDCFVFALVCFSPVTRAAFHRCTEPFHLRHAPFLLRGSTLTPSCECVGCGRDKASHASAKNTRVMIHKCLVWHYPFPFAFPPQRSDHAIVANRTELIKFPLAKKEGEKLKW